MKRIMIITLSLVMAFTSGASAFGQKQSKSEPQAKTKGDRPLPAAPCCDITAIDADNGIVTARNATTGETFQFEVASRSLLRSLQVGQKVYADMAAMKVGVKPAVPCCNITNRKPRR